MLIRIVTLILSLSVALLFTWTLPVWRGTFLPIAITIASLVPFFTLLAGMLRTIFQVEYRLHFVFISEVTQRIVAVILIAIPVAMGVRNSHSAWLCLFFLLCGGIGAFVLFAISGLAARKLVTLHIRWNGALAKKMIQLALPFGAAYFFIALYRQTDLTLIAMLRPDYEVQNAYYGFAFRITDMTFLFPTFLLNSMLPILSGKQARGEAIDFFLGKIFMATMLVGALVAAGSFLWARPIMQLLTTDAYLSTPTQPGADTALQLLSVPMLLNGVILFSFYCLLSIHKWKALVVTLFGAALFSITLDILLIPSMGFVGAGRAAIATHILLSVVLLPQSLRVLPMKILGELLWRVMLFIALSVVGMIALRPLLDSPLETTFFGAILVLWILALMHFLKIKYIFSSSLGR